MIKDIPAFCRLFYLSTGIPVSCYHIPDESSSSFPEIPYDQSIFIKYLFPGTRLKKNPHYYFAQSLCHFGSIYVSSQKTVVILGPVFSTPVSDSVLHSFDCLNGRSARTQETSSPRSSPRFPCILFPVLSRRLPWPILR